MKRGLDANVQYERIQVPVIRTFYGSKHALLILADVRTEFRVLIAPLADAVANRARWVPVAGFEDEITDVEIDGATLWLLANRGHPRGRILRAAVGSPAVARSLLHCAIAAAAWRAASTAEQQAPAAVDSSLTSKIASIPSPMNLSTSPPSVTTASAITSKY